MNSYSNTLGALLAIGFIGFIVFISCDPDGSTEVVGPEGTFVIVKANLMEPIEIFAGRTSEVPGDTSTIFANYPLDTGESVLEYVEGVLFESGTSCVGTRGLIHEPNNDLEITCITASSSNKIGSWNYSESNDQLTYITFAATTVLAFTIVIENTIINNSGITGQTMSFPLPLDTRYSIGSSLPSGQVNLQNVRIELELDRN